MKEDFFDWLNECPTNWILTNDNSEGRSYLFIDNEVEEEDKEEE